MKIVCEEGDGDYEQWQALLLRELVSGIRKRLEEAGIKGKRLRDVVEAIMFDVGAIIDGSQVVSAGEDQNDYDPAALFRRSPSPIDRRAMAEMKTTLSRPTASSS